MIGNRRCHRYYKPVNGLSYIRLGKVMGRDPEQLTDWITSRKTHARKIRISSWRFFSRTSTQEMISVSTKCQTQYQYH
jgi:hypothetical protein